ncbi:class I SAM-dependent methyltransferase [Candidatus Pelagibacter sp.]|nr:class I SAM-dependent methyltransferase [Candidatus Pelagibacter sp.]
MIKYLNIYYWIRKITVNSFFSKFLNQRLLNKIIFNSIYKSNHWNKSSKFDQKHQSYSGPGSIPDSIQTNTLIYALEIFFEKNGIKKILDAPCGDCAWIQKIFNKQFEYTGIDIVKDLIDKNKVKFKTYKNINFYCQDLTNYNNFNDYDFILLRDFFIHLPINIINKILINLKKSNCKYFAFNSYESILINKEITTGQHRKINFLKSPFYLDEPYFKIQEVKNENFPDKKNQDNYIYIYKN